MTSFRVRTAVLAAILLLPAASAAQAPTKEQVGQWVKDLGDGSFNVREEASRKLWEAGEAAEEAVFEAAKSPDAEVARRAAELADKFRWGIYPDTPPKVVELVGRYQVADDNGKIAAVRDMFDAGAPGCATLLKIARAEKDANFRRRLLGQIGLEASRAVPALVAGGSFVNLEALLELAVAADAELALPSYAAYWLLHGGLDGAVTRWKAEAAKPDGKRAFEVLTYLYRAQGDLAAARAAAEKADKPDLLEEVLYQQGDWKALAKSAAPDERQRAEALGFRAAYQRLAGDGAAFEKTVEEIKKSAGEGAENDVLPWQCAKALFLNDRPADALALLEKTTTHADVRFEVLAAQGRYREALAVADSIRQKDNDPRKALVEVLRARLLYDLGEKEQARAIFVRLAEGITPGTETQWEERLVAAEARLGLLELAADHCGRVLAASKSLARAPLLLGRVFPGQGDEAAALWAYLRLVPGKAGDPAATMKQLGDLLGGRATEKEVTALGAAAELATRLPPDEREALLLALVRVAVAAKQPALAAAWRDKEAAHGSAAALIQMGDLLAAKKDWAAAAERYAEAWARSGNDPLPLFLRGHALTQAAKTKEGALWIERARLLPLGNEAVRHAFAEALTERGHADEARRQRDLVLRLSLPGSFYAGDVLRQSALEAAARHEDLRAADLHERAMLRCLDVRISFAESGAYAAVPHVVHRLRARGLLAAGRADEARREMELCEVAMPGDVDLACFALPALERLGRKKEADEVFERCRALHEKRCQEYPGSAREHNSVAWLSARCRRGLDRGLEHAQRAVTLAPEAAGYQDTLGEVYFQRGDKGKALAAARKCVELEPKVNYYRRQLKRIEAGDPKAELPSQGEE